MHRQCNKKHKQESFDLDFLDYLNHFCSQNNFYMWIYNNKNIKSGDRIHCGTLIFTH